MRGNYSFMLNKRKAILYCKRALRVYKKKDLYGQLVEKLPPFLVLNTQHKNGELLSSDKETESLLIYLGEFE